MSWSISCQGVGVNDARLDEADLDTEGAELNPQAVGRRLGRVLRGVVDPVNGNDTRPLIEEMNITRPRARRSRGSTARVSASGPTRFTSNWWCMSARDSVSSGP